MRTTARDARLRIWWTEKRDTDSNFPSPTPPKGGQPHRLGKGGVSQLVRHPQERLADGPVVLAAGKAAYSGQRPGRHGHSARRRTGCGTPNRGAGFLLAAKICLMFIRLPSSSQDTLEVFLIMAMTFIPHSRRMRRFPSASLPCGPEADPAAP